MFNVIYNIGTTCLAPLAMPFFLFSERGRARLAERFGAWNLKEKNVVWFHGASMGEINGILPLIERVRREYPHLRTLVTATSVTGLLAAEGKAHHLRLLPFDSAVWFAHATGGIDLKVVLITETEVWPAMINYLGSKGIPIFLINAKIRDGTVGKYNLIRVVLRKLFRKITKILAAEVTSSERFLSLGADSEKIVLTGNTKYDKAPVRLQEGEINELRARLFRNEDPIITLGSIRPEEEEVWFPAYKRLLEEGHAINMVVAPRHQEKFSYFRERLGAYKIPFQSWSAGASGEGVRVVLLDTVGELTKIYRISDLAFVGATLKDLGGHNPLEPAMFAVPVCIGPHVTNIKDEVQELKKNDAITIVNNEEDAYQIMLRALKGDPNLKLQGERGLQVCKNSVGATQKIMDIVNFSRFV